jgi:NitT/TauT family transport system permease protein
VTGTSLRPGRGLDPDPARPVPDLDPERAGRARWQRKRSRAGRGRKQGALLRLRAEIPLSARVALAFLGLATLFGLWWFAATVLSTDAVLVPTPAASWRAGVDYWNSGELGTDLWASALRVIKGYSLSMGIGIVLGLAIGSYRSIEAFWESPIGFLRYIPATALTPLFLLWLGIDETPKVALIIAGTVFFNILMVADVARNVPRELITASYTLGASRTRVLRRVILPHSWPGIIDVARINLAAAWVMLVVAELLAAQSGLGYRLVQSQRFRQVDRMFAILMIFAIVGLASDLALRGLRNRVAPWARP